MSHATTNITRHPSVDPDRKFKKNGVCVAVDDQDIGDVVVFTNDWYSAYTVVLRGRKAFLKLVERDRCAR